MIVLPISAGTACALSFGNKVLSKLIINKSNKNKKQYEKDQQTIKLFDKLYGKSLRNNFIDKIEYEALCNFFNKNLQESKNEPFL